MKPDLETLRTEIEEYVKTEDFAVFRGFPRLPEPAKMVHWDSEEYPDFRDFLRLPKQLGVPLVVFHHRKLSPAFIDDALDQLDAVDLPDEEYVEYQRRLRELRVFEGFTSAVELSFDYEGRIYLYTRRAEWYEDLLDIADELHDYLAGDEDEEFGDLEEPDEDIGPYFSKN
jgi:hypothetical protein